MKITKELIKSLGLVPVYYDYYIYNGTEDLLETLLRANKDFDKNFCMDIYLGLLNYLQIKKLCVVAVEKVLPIFEKKHPEDHEPRNIFEHSKNGSYKPRDIDTHCYFGNNTASAKELAAAKSAYAAAECVALINDPVVYVGKKSHVEAYAKYTFSYVIEAADNYLEMQEFLITEAVRMLDEEEDKK